MIKLYVLVFVVVVAGLVMELMRKRGRATVEYKYKAKKFFLSAVEHKMYDALVAGVGQNYYVFAQVHLPSIVDNKVVGQNWRGAFRHIDEKSVDFVLCDKAYISPKLVIELDDSSHLRNDRQERDREVERILKMAGVPLLRLSVKSELAPSVLAQQVNISLNPSKTR